MDEFVDLIKKANSKRSAKNLIRRLLKLMEEVGESTQAYLGTTSKTNSKGKTWDDVRAEFSDVFIIATDILLTRLPNETNLADKDFEKQIEKFINRKLNKWKKLKKKTNPILQKKK